MVEMLGPANFADAIIQWRASMGLKVEAFDPLDEQQSLVDQ